MNLPGAIEYTRPAVAQITYTISGLDHEVLTELGANGPVYSRPLGSGFLVSEAGYVITAKHVLDVAEDFQITYRDDGTHHIGVGLAYPNEDHHGVAMRGNLRQITVDVAGTDERNDLALLRLRANPFSMSDRQRTSSRGQVLHPRVAALDPRRPDDGAACAVSGFPLGEPALVTTTGHVASAWAADIKGALVLDETGEYVPTDIADRYLLDVQTNAGNSGGPGYLIDSGAVIGVLIDTRLAELQGEHTLLGVSANLSELTPASCVIELIEQCGVPPLILEFPGNVRVSVAVQSPGPGRPAFRLGLGGSARAGGR